MLFFCFCETSFSSITHCNRKLQNGYRYFFGQLKTLRVPYFFVEKSVENVKNTQFSTVVRAISSNFSTSVRFLRLMKGYRDCFNIFKQSRKLYKTDAPGIEKITGDSFADACASCAKCRKQALTVLCKLPKNSENGVFVFTRRNFCGIMLEHKTPQGVI